MNLQRTITILVLFALLTGCVFNSTAQAAAASQPEAQTASLPYAVVDTGQNKCYDSNGAPITCPAADGTVYGQDAQHNGNLPSYTDNGDGTVTDHVTGLTWQQSPDTDGNATINASDKLTYSAAVSYCNNLSLAGQTDWRLPDIKTLYSLIDFRGTDPSGFNGTDTSSLSPFIDTAYFDFAYGDTAAGERIIDSQYASSTLYVSNTANDGGTTVFGVNFADGRIKGYGSLMPGGGTKTFFVQCVRGNTSYGVNALTENGDGTVTDSATGLMWSQADSGAALNWVDALAWVQTKNAENYLGHNDWRLPNAKELQSILDYTRSPATTNSAAINAAFNATSFTNEGGQTDWPWYWSSTTHGTYNGMGASAAYLAFGRAGGWQKATPSATCFTLYDVHGAGAQRSDPKTTAGLVTMGTACSGGTAYGLGPQGDIQRALNYVRLVRDNVSATTFQDVPTTYWAYSWIEALAANGVTTGCSTVPSLFCPAIPVSRAQMAVFLLRSKHGSSYIPPTATGSVFQDVPANYWSASWIEQLAAEGITGGCGVGLYCPEITVTRDQMAVFLLRSEHGSAYAPPTATGTAFGDIPADHWAADWIEQLVSEGITSGCSGGNYCPSASVTHDQMAVFLVRTFNLPSTPALFNMEQTLSEGAQRNTIAFDALAFLTGNLGADSFFPPGKVADFWGFQYLRDNDPSEMGHNTDFLTRASLNMLHVLTSSQKADLIALAKAQVNSINEYGYKRFVLMQAFRRQLTGDLPAGTTGLDPNAVAAYSAELYRLDGQISYARAQMMGSILSALDADQRAYLDAMVGQGMTSWPVVPEPPELQGLSHDEKVATMTYAGDMFSWYAGSMQADVYFCPERQGTYFGSFYMKDAPAVGNPDYTIPSNLTAEMGEALLQTLTPDQALLITNLVTDQKSSLTEIVRSREEVSMLLRQFLVGGAPSQETVLAQMEYYGQLDGDIIYRYAVAFSQVSQSLTDAQRAQLTTLRTDLLGDLSYPSGAYLYSDAIPMPTIPNTDFLFK
ncbi:MAG: DUF1566 domain-containing protein [Chloroflexi bacterium]|nr:DUF1566 domain-containing protein [Chloroflexota bacterium]